MRKRLYSSSCAEVRFSHLSQLPSFFTPLVAATEPTTGSRPSLAAARLEQHPGWPLDLLYWPGLDMLAPNTKSTSRASPEMLATSHFSRRRKCGAVSRFSSRALLLRGFLELRFAREHEFRLAQGDLSARQRTGKHSASSLARTPTLGSTYFRDSSSAFRNLFREVPAQS